MENAVQALKTAAAVLIFTIAITTTFVMFSKAKATADAVITAQDKQKYLESPEVSGGILYTNSEDIEREGISQKIGDETIPIMTKEGYRIVQPDDVIATLYRYSIEKYGVTIVKQDGTVISRFDSNTENIIRQYYNITDISKLKDYIDKIRDNTSGYIETGFNYNEYNPINDNTLVDIYKIEVDGNNSIKCGAPWYGNNKEIAKRINYQINGQVYELYGQKFNFGPDNNLYDKLNGKKIIEIVNNIDTSKYLKEDDGKTNTNLLTDYQMPTLEIVYVIEE